MAKYIAFLVCMFFSFSLFSQQVATLENGERIYLYPDGTWSRYQEGNRGAYIPGRLKEKILSSTLEDNTVVIRIFTGGNQRVVKERIDVIGKEVKAIRLQRAGGKEKIITYKLTRIGIGTEMFEYATLDYDDYTYKVVHSNPSRAAFLQSALEEGGFVAPLFQERHAASQPKFGAFTMEEAKLISANMYETLLADKLEQAYK